MSQDDAHGAAPGWIASLRAGLSAGAVCGLVAGLGDGVCAAFLMRASIGPLAFLGCLAAAVFQYSLLACCALALVGLALHPFLRRRTAAQRYRILLALGLAAALFAASYWWTRPFVFYGHSATSPERLASAAGMALVALALGFVLAHAITRIPRRGQLALSLAVCAAWLGGGVYLAAQQGLGAQRGALNERNRDLPNVVLIVVDALRQDMLGCYGNARVKTPNIDRLAQQGVLFENAFVDAPYTWTSFGSLLTGKYPRRHGLMRMEPGVEMLPTTTLPQHLKRAVRRDGPTLQPEDYLTASFHTGTLQQRSGLLEGFDLLYEETAGHELADLSSPWSQFRSELLLWVFKNRVEKRFDSGVLASAACRWIESIPGRRFMTMVHLYSTHTPYDPPAAFRAMYCDPAYSGPIHAFYAEHRYAIEAGTYAPTPADVQQIRDLYAAGVSQADALIGNIVSSLERSGALANTLVIVTADHGESLGEDGLWEHNHLVRRELRVPLVMSLPGQLPAGQRVAPLVDEIDVLPTVCDLAGLGLPPPTSEREVIDGLSLLPLVRGKDPASHAYSYAENGMGVSIQDLGRLLSVPRSVLSAKTPKEAHKLYDQDLESAERGTRYCEYSGNSTEERDVLTDKREETRQLFKVLDYWSRSLPIPAWNVRPSRRDLDDEERQHALGYDQGKAKKKPKQEQH